MDEGIAVPDEAVEPVGHGGIVVGHDGSDCADAALEMALQLGRDLHAPVTVVTAWSIATAPRPANWTFGYAASLDELAEAVHQDLLARTANAVDRYPTVEVSCRAYHGNAARSLIEASRGARMLVVGSRGLGGFAEMVLGSVSDQVVRYATCPVLVAKTEADGD